MENSICMYVCSQSILGLTRGKNKKVIEVSENHFKWDMGRQHYV